MIPLTVKSGIKDNYNKNKGERDIKTGVAMLRKLRRWKNGE